MTIEELIERLEKATGPDRNIDADIYVTITEPGWHKAPNDVGGVATDPRMFWPEGKVRYITKSSSYAPRYTSSIDDAVALCERVLPEANCCGAAKDKTGWNAFVSRNDVASGHWLVEAEGPTVPIALLLAILRAKARLND